MLLKERGPEQQMKKLLGMIGRTSSNEVLLEEIAGGAQRAARDEKFQKFIDASAGVRSLTNPMNAFRAGFGVIGLKPPEAVAQFIQNLRSEEQKQVRALLEKRGLVATANSVPPTQKKKVVKSKKAKERTDNRPEVERLADVGLSPEQARLPA